MLGSGTEAVMGALRLARIKTGKSKIIKIGGAYHGWSDQAFISTKPSLNEAGPADTPVPVAGSPGMPPSVLDDVVVCGWNDLDLLEQALKTCIDRLNACDFESSQAHADFVLNDFLDRHG